MTDTPQRRASDHRPNLTSVAIGLVVIVAIAIGGCMWLVAGYLDDRSQERHDDVEREQIAQIQRSRVGCELSLTDRAEGIQRDQDIADFAGAAARKNRKVGGTAEIAAAADYERIAKRASDRQQSAMQRMRGADPDPRRIVVTRRVACARAYPLP